MILLICFCFFCGAWNLARGEKLFNVTDSAVLGRAISMGGIGLLAGVFSDYPALIPLIFGGLMFWCTFAWDNYWSAAIGNPTDVNKKAFLPVDLLMKRLPFFRRLYATPGLSGPSALLRLWGSLAMGLRGFMGLYPLFIVLGTCGFNSAYIIGTASIFQGVPYLLFGLLRDKHYVIAMSEFTWGCAIGVMLGISIF